MPIVQSDLGTWSGTSINVTLPSNSGAGNRVAVFLMGNDNTSAGASGFTQRTTQVGTAGHFLYDKQGDGTAAWTLASNSAGGAGIWIAVEIEGGVYDTSNSARTDGAGATTAVTPTITPASGHRLILAGIGCITSNSTSDYFTAWSNSYVETIEGFTPASDQFQHGVAALEADFSGGSTDTTATLATSSNNRYRVIASYLTTSTPPPGTVWDVDGTVPLVFGTPSAGISQRMVVDPIPSQWVFDVPRATVTGGTPGTGGTGRTDGPTTLCGELNRLAGRTMGINWLSETGAANVWAGTTNLSLVDALHVKAGITDIKTYMDLQGVCNVLGGITDPKNWQAPAGALARRES